MFFLSLRAEQVSQVQRRVWGGRGQLAAGWTAAISCFMVLSMPREILNHPSCCVSAFGVDCSSSFFFLLFDLFLLLRVLQDPTFLFRVDSISFIKRVPVKFLVLGPIVVALVFAWPLKKNRKERERKDGSNIKRRKTHQLRGKGSSFQACSCIDSIVLPSIVVRLGRRRRRRR